MSCTRVWPTLQSQTRKSLLMKHRRLGRERSLPDNTYNRALRKMYWNGVGKCNFRTFRRDVKLEYIKQTNCYINLKSSSKKKKKIKLFLSIRLAVPLHFPPALSPPRRIEILDLRLRRLYFCETAGRSGVSVACVGPAGALNRAAEKTVFAPEIACLFIQSLLLLLLLCLFFLSRSPSSSGRLLSSSTIFN